MAEIQQPGYPTLRRVTQTIMESTPSGTEDQWARFIANNLQDEVNPDVPIDDVDNCRSVVNDKKTLRQCRKTIKKGAEQPFCYQHQLAPSRHHGIVGDTFRASIPAR